MAAIPTSPPAPCLPSEESPPEPGSCSKQDKEAATMWRVLLAPICWVTDVLCQAHIRSLDTIIWSKFDHSMTYDAPISPSYFTEKQRKSCNPRIIEVFCQVMANYRAAVAAGEDVNPHLLSYTRYGVALEGEDFDKLCHNALSLSVQDWLAEKEIVQLGRLYEEMKEDRPALSPDFIRAFFPLCPALPIREICISGPIREEDRLLVKNGLLEIATLATIHFELEKESAEYFLPTLPEILTRPTITVITFRNYGTEKLEDFCIVQDETWTALIGQDQCAITFTKTPQPPEPHNRLTFN